MTLTYVMTLTNVMTLDLQEKLEEMLVPRIEVDAGKKTHIVRYLINRQLGPYVNNRESIFERVTPINEQLANKMIRRGYKQPSRFGRWCPVKASVIQGCVIDRSLVVNKLEK